MSVFVHVCGCGMCVYMCWWVGKWVHMLVRVLVYVCECNTVPSYQVGCIAAVYVHVFPGCRWVGKERVCPYTVYSRMCCWEADGLCTCMFGFVLCVYVFLGLEKCKPIYVWACNMCMCC